MPKIDSTRFYLNTIKKYGTTPKGVSWLSAHNQTVRFKEIVQLLPTALTSFSIGDAGCGFADFYKYLVHIDRKPKLYTGIDSLYEMTTIATNQTPDEILHLDICKETLPIRDYYVCSGALSLLTLFETHLFLQNCYNSSREAFIFNTLYGSKQSDTYNYLQKEFIESVAKKLNVKKVIYTEGYLESDITVMFIKK